MSNIEFLTVDDVQVIHRNQTALYGGDPSLRDQGLLESAVAQAQAEFGGQLLHSYPYEMAAAYLYHIVKNHPFVDGNKRTGAVAALAFLELNGFDPNAPRGVLYSITLAAAEGRLGKPEIAKRLAELVPQ